MATLEYLLHSLGTRAFLARDGAVKRGVHSVGAKLKRWLTFDASLSPPLSSISPPPLVPVTFLHVGRRW